MLFSEINSARIEVSRTALRAVREQETTYRVRRFRLDPALSQESAAPGSDPGCSPPRISACSEYLMKNAGQVGDPHNAARAFWD